jgi:uncharacterized membrane protein
MVFPIIKAAMNIKPSRAIISRLLKIILVFATGLLLAAWLWETPGGLLGKADGIAYAVCHRISARTFFLGDRPIPLCARCSGMYLGALVGLLYQIRLGRRGGMPPLKIMLVLGAFLVAFGIDGVNSYVRFFPHAAQLYESQNWLRLVTGTGLGLGLALVLLPVVNQTLWIQCDDLPYIPSWRSFLGLLACAAVMVLALLSENPLALYPLALLSSLTVLIILSMVYLMVWVLISKRDNTYRSWREIWVPLVAGFGTALLQIAVLDAGRFWLTGTWNGFPFG